MAADCRALIAERIRERGPITVAEYVELALYDPECGYYARASVRTGRAGDFFTSVDVGPMFGELLAVQIAEMWRFLDGHQGPGTRDQGLAAGDDSFDLVEAGAGNGRLARDILGWLQAHDPACFAAVRLHLVERSARARRDQPRALGPHISRLKSSADTLPARIDGVLYANELLDALPTHLVEMSTDGLREVFVDLDGDRLVERMRPPSSPDLASYLARAGVALEAGWRAEINLNALAWVKDAARQLSRGFLLLVDYGQRAVDLYSEGHAAGTLTTFTRHTAAGPDAGPGLTRPWLEDPGSRDITSHVDLTSLVRAAEDEGLATLAVLDQTYFLLGLGLAERLAESTGDGPDDLRRRLALKTLMMPGGLGSTHKVMLFGREVGLPRLRGFSHRVRVT
jgi:SAM-dependent MidA family methyltransferase